MKYIPEVPKDSAKEPNVNLRCARFSLTLNFLNSNSQSVFSILSSDFFPDYSQFMTCLVFLLVMMPKFPIFSLFNW